MKHDAANDILHLLSAILQRVVFGTLFELKLTVLLSYLFVLYFACLSRCHMYLLVAISNVHTHILYNFETGMMYLRTYS